MKYLVLLLVFMVLMSIGIMYTMVEMYRIETESYNSRMSAFYDAFFDYMAEYQDAAPQEAIAAEQPDANAEIVM